MHFVIVPGVDSFGVHVHFGSILIRFHILSPFRIGSPRLLEGKPFGYLFSADTAKVALERGVAARLKGEVSFPL